MKAKRMSTSEQLRLITECRQSGLSDYQWCQLQEIKPGTFYNWIRRLRDRGTIIPTSSTHTLDPSSLSQEVVPLTFATKQEMIPAQRNANSCFLENPNLMLQPSVEILIGNATIRFFNHTEQQLVERTLNCLGGNLYDR